MGKQSKQPLERFSNYDSAARRYFSGVMGSMLDEEFDINSDWRGDKGWEAVVKKEFKNKCVYCEKEHNSLHREHLDAIAKGGLDCRANVVPACGSCNSSKKDSFTWEEFMRKKGENRGLTESQILNRIKFINKHRNKYQWKKIKSHPLNKEMEKMAKVYPDFLGEKLKDWTVSWIFYSYGGTDYLYHLTTEDAWNSARTAGKYPAALSERPYISCAYENQIGKVAGNKIWPQTKVVLLCLEKSTIKSIDLECYEINSYTFQDTFWRILGSIPLGKILHHYGPFTFTGSQEDIYTVLKNHFPSSLTAKGIRFR